MKRIPTSKFFIMIFTALLTFSSIAAACKGPVIPENPVNKEVLNFRDFSLNAESVGLTSTIEGTIFVKGEEQKSNARHIQISARLEIDPGDWGGASFQIPQGWKVINIASDYPQGDPGPERYADIWHTEAQDNFPTRVEIGHTKYKSYLTQGGRGSLFIELDPVSTEKALPQSVEIGVGIGSKGDVVVNPVFDRITVPLNIDYRTPGQTKAPFTGEADTVVMVINGNTIPLAKGTAEFSQISREAVRMIEGVNNGLPNELGGEELWRLRQTTDYLEIGFDPAVEVTTSRIVVYTWERVKLSSAIFFFGGDYYGLVALPDTRRSDRYGIYDSDIQIKDLERLVKGVKVVQ